MQQLDAVPFFLAEKKLILASPLFHTISNVIVHDAGELANLLKVAESVRLGAKALREAIGAILPDGDEKTIVVKLPETDDLGEIVAYLGSLQKAIENNIVNQEIQGQVGVKSWQPGSLWLDIYLGSIAAMTLVGGMAWAAAVVCKKWNEAKILEKIVDSMEIKNQMLDGLRSGVDDHVKLVVESEAKNLFAHNFKEGDNPEQIERLKMGIKELAKLIQKGAEVHPSLTAPEPVKNLFPDFTKLNAIESKQKLIKEKNSTDANPA